jgi:hypothetical protein
MVPKDVAQAIQAQDWLSFPSSPGYRQETWARRCVDNNSVLQEVNSHISQAVAQINQQLGTNMPDGVVWWLDLPGFDVKVHCDNSRVKTALQMYWIAPSSEYGTVFYSDDQPGVDFTARPPDQLDLVHRFPSCANTGYLMRNEPDSVTGQPPRLWHGMHNPVPAGHIRLSSYTVSYE